jgi:hypothetical protein
VIPLPGKRRPEVGVEAKNEKGPTPGQTGAGDETPNFLAKGKRSVNLASRIET